MGFGIDLQLMGDKLSNGNVVLNQGADRSKRRLDQETGSINDTLANSHLPLFTGVRAWYVMNQSDSQFLTDSELAENTDRCEFRGRKSVIATSLRDSTHVSKRSTENIDRSAHGSIRHKCCKRGR